MSEQHNTPDPRSGSVSCAFLPYFSSKTVFMATEVLLLVVLVWLAARGAAGFLCPFVHSVTRCALTFCMTVAYPFLCLFVVSRTVYSICLSYDAWCIQRILKVKENNFRGAANP